MASSIVNRLTGIGVPLLADGSKTVKRWSFVMIAMLFCVVGEGRAQSACSNEVSIGKFPYGHFGQPYDPGDLGSSHGADSEKGLRRLCRDRHDWCHDEYQAILSAISGEPNAANLEREAHKQFRRCQRHYSLECEAAAAEICREADKIAERETSKGTVRQAQNLLTQLGYDPGPIDGVFGDRTQDALDAFLRRHPTRDGFRPLGHIDREMIKHLEAVAAQHTAVESGRQSSDGSERGMVRRIQTLLVQLGYDPGPIDGLVGDKTIAALEAFASDYPPDPGVKPIGLETLTQLEALAARYELDGDRKYVDPRRELGTDGLVEEVSGEICRDTEGEACWKNISNMTDCYIWDPAYVNFQVVTWSGGCKGVSAHGVGTLRWSGGGVEDFELEGNIVNGKMQGHWAKRFSTGIVGEGPLVDGEMHGLWIFRHPNGSRWQNEYVKGTRTK